MLITTVGIIKVIAKRKYHAAKETREIFHRCNVELIVVEIEVENFSIH